MTVSKKLKDRLFPFGMERRLVATWRWLYTMSVFFGFVLCRSSCKLLFERFLGHQILVRLAFVKICVGFLSEPEKSHHSKDIVPESHKKGPDAEECSTAGGRRLDGLDLHHQVTRIRSVGRDGLDARADPFAIHHALACSALTLPATVLDILSGLGCHVADGLAGPGHTGLGFVALFKEYGDRPLQTDTGVSELVSVT